MQVISKYDSLRFISRFHDLNKSKPKLSSRFSGFMRIGDLNYSKWAPIIERLNSEMHSFIELFRNELYCKVFRNKEENRESHTSKLVFIYISLEFFILRKTQKANNLSGNLVTKKKFDLLVTASFRWPAKKGKVVTDGYR